MNDVSVKIDPTTRLWRITAGRVVEELFPMTAEASWNDLLDLRELLVHGEDWPSVLECFLKCRRSMEEDHYLPFYRLRKILAAHLQLENAGISLASLLRKRNFSFRKWQQQAALDGRDAKVLEGAA